MRMNIFGRLGFCMMFYACLGHNSLAWAEKHVEHNTSKIKAPINNNNNNTITAIRFGNNFLIPKFIIYLMNDFQLMCED